MKLQLRNTSIFNHQHSPLRGFELLTGDVIQRVRFFSEAQEMFEPFAEAQSVIFEFQEYGDLEISADQAVEVINSDCLVVYDEQGSRFEIIMSSEAPLNLLPVNPTLTLGGVTVEKPSVVMVQFQRAVRVFVLDQSFGIAHIMSQNCVEPAIDKLLEAGYAEIKL